MKVIIQKPDLDTCMTGLLLGINMHDNVIIYGNADKADIENPDIICIEAGGSGLVHLNNFDHHDSSALPPACIQAMDYLNIRDIAVKRLVHYISLVDMAEALPRSIAFPSLSNLFSGMQLVENSNIDEQFFSGIKLLNQVIELNIDPFQSLPARKEWERYIEAKQINWAMVNESLLNTKFYYTKQDRKIGFCSQNNIGGIGSILKMECDIAVLYSDSFGKPNFPKYTIASSSINVSELLPILNKQELGWGGHQKIIGSPRDVPTVLTNKGLINMIIQAF